MPSSRNRYARAQARARYRKPKRRSGSMGWNVAIVVVVLVGLGVLVLTLNEEGSSGAGEPPQAPSGDEVGDHWHALYAVNVCNEWIQQPIPEFETRDGNPNVGAGIHTHGDGFVHIHPFASDEEGSNATLGRFWDFAGLEMSGDSFSYVTGTMEEPDTTSWQSGDECPNGRTGQVRWEVNGEEMTGNPAEYRLEDRDCIAIAFLPEGREIGTPPQAGSSPVDDGSGTGAFPCAGAEEGSSSPTTTVPGAATTVPAVTDPNATTPTSGAP